MATPRWSKQALARVHAQLARPTAGPRLAAVERAERLLQKALDVAEDALDASERRMVVKGGGKTQTLETPDWRARLGAVRLICEVCGIAGSRRPAEVPEPPTFEVFDPPAIGPGDAPPAHPEGAAASDAVPVCVVTPLVDDLVGRPAVE